MADAGWLAENTLTVGGFDAEGKQVREHHVTYYAPSTEASLELVDVLTLLVAQEMGGKPV